MEPHRHIGTTLIATRIRGKLIAADRCPTRQHLAANAPSQFVEVLRNLAERPQYRRIVEITEIRIARTPERKRANVWRLPGQGFCVPDSGTFVRALLRFTGRDSMFGRYEWQCHVIVTDIAPSCYKSSCLSGTSSLGRG